MPRKYTKIEMLSDEIFRLKEHGKTHREIGELYGLTKEQIAEIMHQPPDRRLRIRNRTVHINNMRAVVKSITVALNHSLNLIERLPFSEHIRLRDKDDVAFGQLFIVRPSGSAFASMMLLWYYDSRTV